MSVCEYCSVQKQFAAVVAIIYAITDGKFTQKKEDNPTLFSLQCLCSLDNSTRMLTSFDSFFYLSSFIYSFIMRVWIYVSNYYRKVCANTVVIMNCKWRSNIMDSASVFHVHVRDIRSTNKGFYFDIMKAVGAD